MSLIVTVGLTGASGMPYAIRLIDILLQNKCQVYLVYTKAAQIVSKQECNLVLSSNPKTCQKMLCDYFQIENNGLLQVFGIQDWYSPIASGTTPSDVMIICPCTMGTLASIACGLSQDLVERGADVILKERKKLIIVPRESPFSSIHLENMLKLSNLGAVILPPTAGFYNHPQTIQDMIDFVVAKILDQLSIPQTLLKTWGVNN